MRQTRSAHRWSHRHPRPAAAAVASAVGLALLTLTVQHPAAASTSVNTSVDFGSVVGAVGAADIATTESTYSSGLPLVSDLSYQAAMSRLGAGQIRIPLTWSNGRIVSGATGGDTGPSGDAWIAAIRAVGAEPVVIVLDASPSAAAAMVTHFRAAGTPVHHWIIGNEPDNAGISAATYSASFNASADAMKAVDSTITTAGPATAWFNTSYLQTFLDLSGSRVDVVDFHAYGNGGSNRLSSADLMSRTHLWQDDVTQLHAMISATVPTRAAQIGVEVGEYNQSWAVNASGLPTDTRNYQAFTTAWAASVLGHVLAASGTAFQYADKNGPLGLVFEHTTDATQYGQTVDTPMPIYHALGMFTGEGLFPHFGTTLVKASTTLPNVEVYASTNPHNLVLVNKDPTTGQTASIATGLGSATADTWQTDPSAPFAAPHQVATALPLQAGQLSQYLPPYSVTTITLTRPTPTTTPTPASSPAPTPRPTPSPSPALSPAAPGAGGAARPPAAPVPPTPAPGAPVAAIHVGLANGGFEDGSLRGWLRTGVATVSRSHRHRGRFAAVVGGSRTIRGGSAISQRFRVPAGARQLSLWYLVRCPATRSGRDWAAASIVDLGDGRVRPVLPRVCREDVTWHLALVAVLPGHRYRLVLSSHDGAADLPSYARYDDVRLS